MKPRYQFIPELREAIADQIPFGSMTERLESIKRWEDGHQPRGALDHGVFAACDKVKTEIQGGGHET